MNIGFDDGIEIHLIWLKQQYYINIHTLCLLHTSRKGSCNLTGPFNDWRKVNTNLGIRESETPKHAIISMA